MSARHALAIALGACLALPAPGDSPPPAVSPETIEELVRQQASLLAEVERMRLQIERLARAVRQEPGAAELPDDVPLAVKEARLHMARVLRRLDLTGRSFFAIVEPDSCFVGVLAGRWPCGWLCPFGSLHQFVGYLAKRKKSLKTKIELNRYRSAQSLKYWILVFVLTMAIADLAIDAVRLPRSTPLGFAVLVALALAAVIVAAIRQAGQNIKKLAQMIEWVY